MKLGSFFTLISTSSVAATQLVFSLNLGAASAATLTVKGTDAVFLAGDNATINQLPINNPPGSSQATFPQAVSAISGEQFSFTASGTVTYGPGFSSGPDGVYSFNITSLDGISGYSGPAVALLGVFLDDTNPSSASPPATLDFNTIGTSFTSLAPKLDQVFFIGDGLTGTGSGQIQSFVAPVGATRLFLGVPDTLNYIGVPGAYDNNGGSYSVTISTATPIPTPTPTKVPEPSAAGGLLVLGAGWLLRKKSNNIF